MAIALEDFGGGSADGATTTIDVTGIDVQNGNEILYVAICSASTLASTESATVTWDAAGANQNIPFLAGSKNNNPSRSCSLYRLIGPTPGTNKTVSISGLSAALNDVAIVASFSGVHQTTPNGTLDLVESGGGGATTTTTSGSITCAAGNWIISFAHGGSGHAVVGGGQTLRHSQVLGNAAVVFADDRDGADDQVEWTHASVTDVGAISFELKASTAPPVSISPGVGADTITGQAATVALNQWGRPASDVSIGGWTTSGAGTTNLFDEINEGGSANDADFIRSGASPSNDTAIFPLTTLQTPQAGTVTMRVRAKHV